MEGLRKGSLFPFPEKGRGEGSVPRRFLHPAGGPGQEGPLSASGAQSYMVSGFRGGTYPLSRYVLHPAGLLPFANFACFPMTDGLSAPARRTPYHAGKPGGAGHAARVAPETGGTPAVEQPRFHSWCGDPVPGPSHAGRDASAGPAPHDSGTPWKERIFRP